MQDEGKTSVSSQSDTERKEKMWVRLICFHLCVLGDSHDSKIKE